MKVFVFFAILFCTVSIYLYSSNNNYNFVEAGNTTNNSLVHLLDLYYNIKDALVNSDAAIAASKADEFVKAIQKIDMNFLTKEENKALAMLLDNLSIEAKDISQSKDLSIERMHFASLSDNIYLLAEKVKLSAQPIYRDYCPMKKKFWLSSEPTIKNPYFGKAMPTCGSIAETLK